MAIDCLDQLLWAKRLADYGEVPRLEIVVQAAGHDNHFDLGAFLKEALTKIETVQFAHFHIGEKDFDFAGKLSGQVERLVCTRSTYHAESAIL